ncbi:MAG: F0F1 ATP synthase subunit B [Elusimicrobia bacterium]|nr:F0F1 ATP synthase subunit B [Elusimicrobiota bacterium]
MDKLFSVDVGLMAWTVITFLLLVAVLTKYGWRPLMEALDAREARLKADAEAAQAAREGAEKAKADFDAKLAEAYAQGRELVAQAAKEAEAAAARIRAEARAQAQKSKEAALTELADEKRRLIGELRGEVAELSVMAAEKLLRRSVDPAVEKTVLDSFLAEMDKRKS